VNRFHEAKRIQPRGKRTWTSCLMVAMFLWGIVPVAATDVVKPDSMDGSPFIATREFAQKEVLSLPAVTLASLKSQEAFDDWSNAIARAENLDTEKVTVVNAKTGITTVRMFSDVTQLQLRIQKYLLPDQMRLAWQVASKMTDITIMNLENNMDSMLLSIYRAQGDVKMKTRSVDLLVNGLVRMKSSKAAGLITQLDLEDYALEFERAEKALSASRRFLENQCRSYNQFAGAPLSRPFTVALSQSGSLPLLTAEEYVVQALQNRLEVFTLRENTALTQRYLEILTFRNLDTLDSDVHAEYVRTGLNLEKLRAQLSIATRDVTAEIHSAALAIKSANHGIGLTSWALEQQKEKMEMLEDRISSGSMPSWSDDALVHEIAGMKEELEIERVSLVNIIRKFRQATQFGPEFSTR
jgi:hypothetical protein